MKIFGGDAITRVYNTLGADEDMPLESKLLSNAVESAQRKVEGKNFSIRKNVLQYDDVMNTQREIIYKQRKEVLDGQNLKNNITKMISSVAETVASHYLSEEVINKEALEAEIENIFAIKDLESVKQNRINSEEVIQEITQKATEKYEQQEKEIGETDFRELERVVMLKVVDQKWWITSMQWMN